MRISHPKVEGKIHASKWLSHRALLDASEMESLLSALPKFAIYNVSEIVYLEEAEIPVEDFFVSYVDYITSIKAGLIPDEAALKPYFSAAFSALPDALYAMEVKEEEYIIKTREPVVQLGFHHFTFSPEQKTFHSMVHSKESITWGLQFSYPQIYSNSLTNDVVEIFKDSNHPNTALFKTLAKWIRAHTTPTPFVFGGERQNATFRLGKDSKHWVREHPQLPSNRLSLLTRCPNR